MRQLLPFLLSCLLIASGLVTTPAAAEDETVDGMPLVKKKPIYVSMLPHFTVNLQGGGRFMRLKANTLVANDETKEALNLHMPAVRHNILMKLSHLTAEDFATSAQKDQLREEIAEIIRKTLRDNDEADDVRGFFITSLVMQ
jgi:flagellar FliL protein